MTNKPTNKIHFPKLKEAEKEVLKELDRLVNPKGESKFEELSEYLVDWLTTSQTLQRRVLESLCHTHRNLGHSEPVIRWLGGTHKSQRAVFYSLITMHQNLGNENSDDPYDKLLAESFELEKFYRDLVTRCQELQPLLITARAPPQP